MNVAGAVDDGEHAAAEGDRRGRCGPGELADLGTSVASPSSGMATSRPSVVAATTAPAAGARLLEHDRRRLAVGAGHLDVERRAPLGRGHDEVAVGVGEHGRVGRRAT